jgi:four helix bundle protein
MTRFKYHDAGQNSGYLYIYLNHTYSKIFIFPMHNFKELKVWQLSRKYVKDIYELTKKLPQEELYCLITQMRRASISIPSNISEGAGRNSDKDFHRFLDIASGSAFEAETQLFLCYDVEYITEDMLNSYLDKIQKMLYNFKMTLNPD